MTSHSVPALRFASAGMTSDQSKMSKMLSRFFFL